MRSFPRPRCSHWSSSAAAERTEHHPVALQQLRKPLTNLSLKPPCRRTDALPGCFGEMSEAVKKQRGRDQRLLLVSSRVSSLFSSKEAYFFLFTTSLALLTLSTAKTSFPPLSSVSQNLHACVAPQANKLPFFRRGPSIYRRAAAAAPELLVPQQTAALYLCLKWAS